MIAAHVLWFLVFSAVSSVEGNDTSRNAVAPSSITTERSIGCTINISRDLKKNSRLILHPDSSSTDGYRFVLPTAGHSLLTFQHGQEVVFACPNGVYERAKCNTGDNFAFLSSERNVSVSQITCRRPLRATVRNSGRCYNNEYNHVGVGLTVRQDQSTREFIKLFDICFDPQLRSSAYAKFTLMQGVENGQKNVKRSYFKCTQKLDEIYGRGNQHTALVNLTGSGDEADKYINRNTSSDLYLTKGHLIAFKDFVYNSQQEVTLLCLNSVPIWQVVRRGNWRNVESSIRQYASRHGKDLTVYAGTYGILHLPHVNGTSVPVYLGTDTNGRNVLPVPQLFWKIVYDRLMRHGIAFLVINNYREDTYPKEHEVCTDVCNRTESWFNGWDRQQISLGYVYCCTVTEFLVKTNAIPEFREVVIDLLIYFLLVIKHTFRTAASRCTLPRVTLFIRRKCESMTPLKQSALPSVLLLTALSAYQNFPDVQATEFGCSVPISSISVDTPLILQHRYRNGMAPFHMPSNPGSDSLTFGSGDAVRFACPDANKNLLLIPNSPLTVYEVIAFCIKGSIFSISGTSHDFSSIRCKKPPQPTIKQEKRCAVGNGTQYNIGFNLKRKFLGLIEICYDIAKHSTISTRYILSKSVGNHDVNDYTNISFSSSNFGSGNTGSPEDLYTCKNQIRTLGHILGSITQANKYINCDYRSNKYLDRCHLAPYEDFLFGYQKKAASFYINTAPQWKAINIGNWDILERRIRRYASKQKADLTIVSGTINVTTLPDIFGTERYVYLPEDPRSSSVVPVPALFWKLVHDKARNAGIVFVVVSNPYHHDLLTRGYVACTDVCSSTPSWFGGWNRLDVSSGYVYCCTVNEFGTKSGIKPFPFRAKHVLG
ncbi:uncharacterized protein LOC111871958 [Cryptotermes secundus]|uniref:uncharacterized protein LOC111871958 n=1 Tax=Cryptotermes secundus TaxID=105785 RepID=UPI001454D968|nr:uncharacterized protein LOC111871958 [Cryptotermes secundus]